MLLQLSLKPQTLLVERLNLYLFTIFNDITLLQLVFEFTDFFVAAGHSGTLYINISGRQLTVRLFLVKKWSGITEKKFILLKVVNFSLEIIETGKWH